MRRIPSLLLLAALLCQTYSLKRDFRFLLDEDGHIENLREALEHLHKARRQNFDSSSSSEDEEDSWEAERRDRQHLPEMEYDDADEDYRRKRNRDDEYEEHRSADKKDERNWARDIIDERLRKSFDSKEDYRRFDRRLSPEEDLSDETSLEEEERKRVRPVSHHVRDKKQEYKRDEDASGGDESGPDASREADSDDVSSDDRRSEVSHEERPEILRDRARRQEYKRYFSDANSDESAASDSEASDENPSDEDERSHEHRTSKTEREFRFIPRATVKRQEDKRRSGDNSDVREFELESANDNEMDFLRNFMDKRNDEFAHHASLVKSEEMQISDEDRDDDEDSLENESEEDAEEDASSEDASRDGDAASSERSQEEMESDEDQHQSRSSQESDDEDGEFRYPDAASISSEASLLESEQIQKNLELMLAAENGKRSVDVDLRYSVDLDTTGQWLLDWDIVTATQIIIFRLKVRRNNDGHGWLIFGFSDYGEPTDADVIAFWTTNAGIHHFEDSHTDSEGILHSDRHQDYTLLAAELGLDSLSLVFSREYDTCDDDDYIIDPGTTHMIFASGVGPVVTLKGSNVTSLDPGLQRAQLIQSQLPDPELPDDAREFVMHVNEVPIPAVETTYWCSVQQLPEFTTKHHIIKFEGAISEASRGIVHHLEVFHCELPPGEKPRDYNAACKSMAERPRGLEVCRNVIGAWAMGASGLTYPPEAGYAIGGKDFNRYVMLEVHYNNPQLVGGVIDSSGIRFTITNQLREHDAGIMELGLEYTDKMALPPHQPLWTLAGYCVPDCTQVALPEGGIRVFASQLHTHLTGKRAYTKHYRHGIELPELNRDNHYSPHYQSIRKLPHQVAVLPGDSLVTTCVDNTESRDNITMGGFAISDEMCVNYIHYYPKVDLEVCKSSVTLRSLYGFFKFMHEYQEEPTSEEMGISDNYKSIHWSRMNAELLRTYYEQAPLAMQCNQSDGYRFPGNWEGLPIPEVRLPLPPEERPCLQ